METVTLKSGKKVVVHVAPLEEANSLKKAILREMKLVKMSNKDEVHQAMKDAACGIFSSDEVEACVNACMKRCIYDGKTIKEDTFESPEARKDLTEVQIAVAKANFLPFFESLYSGLLPLLDRIKAVLQG